MLSKLAAVAAALCAAAVLRVSADTCDEEYWCMYRSPDDNHNWYDLRPLCQESGPHSFTPPGSDATFYWQVCGSINSLNCTPPYDVSYQQGSVMQFFGAAPTPGSQCADKISGGMTNCTKDCEVLSVGAPTFNLFNASDPSGGVNITHVGVVSLKEDSFKCPFDPVTGGYKPREVTISVLCDPLAEIPRTDHIREFAVCQYEIVMKSKYGCGCEPDCYEKNCGGDGCRGYCGGAGNRGRCPDGFDCTDDGQCCKPDCTNRYCGDDGCGGSCGDCDTGMNCTRYQQCAPDPRLVSPSQQPAQFAPVTVPTSTSGDYAASFIGGIISAGVVTVGMTWFFKIRAAVAASGGGYGRL